MTTVADLMTYLATLPPETEVDVMVAYSGSYTMETRYDSLDLSEYSDTMDFIDFRGNPHMSEDNENFGKTFLTFGGNL